MKTKAILFNKSQSHLFHFFENGRLSDDSRSFLDDLLMSPLYRTVPSEQRDSVSVLIGQQLHFQMTSALGQLHHENRRTGYLSLYLSIIKKNY